MHQRKTIGKLFTVTIAFLSSILILLTPIPFGSVQPISIFFIEIGVLLCFLLWAAKRFLVVDSNLSPEPKDSILTGARGGINRTLLILLGFIAFQIIPLPGGIIAAISPNTAELVETAAKAASSSRQYFPISLDPYASFAKFCEYASYFLLFLILADALSHRYVLRIVIGALIVSALFQTVYGGYEALTGRGQIFGYQKPDHVLYASGTFINTNHFASYLAILSPLFMSFLIWNPGETKNKMIRVLKTLLPVVLLSGMMLAIILARSRAGIAISVVSGGLYLILISIMHRKVQGPLIFLAIVAVCLVAGTRIDLPDMVKKFANLPADLSDPSGRLQVWRDTIDVYSSFPVAGTGAGTFPQVFPMYQTIYEASYAHAHNDVLELISETGTVGLALLATLLYYLAKRLVLIMAVRQSYRTIQLGAFVSLIAVSLTSMIHFTLQIPAIALTATVLAAIFFVDFETLSASDQSRLESSPLPVTA